MHKTKLEVAINIAIDLLVFYYILMLVNPNLRVYVRNYMQTLRYHLWKLTLAKWQLEAKQVRGEI